MIIFEIEMKLEQTENYCKISKNKESYLSVANIIPDKIILETKPIELGKLIDNIWQSWEKTKKIHESDIISEGAIWDEKNQRLIELCQN